METTFITIHDLTPEATLLYTSDSIVDILGYQPEEVVNRSCWDFFHPDELPVAKEKHNRGVQMDKAAVISYCRMRDKDGRWLGCEVVFTVVYDVMVGCTSIYRRGVKSQNRAVEAPVIRRLFSTSPRDPRYHMLSHLSTKFTYSKKDEYHEPRAALFLNRYTRTLTIMYATNGLADILGISGEELRGQSFYFCIQENCLQDSVRCLENAKANDSIAYLRFWFRDPREHDRTNRMDVDQPENDAHFQSGSEEEGGVGLNHHFSESPAVSGLPRDLSMDSNAVSSTDSDAAPPPNSGSHLRPIVEAQDARHSSGESSNPHSRARIFGEESHDSVSSASTSHSPELDRRRNNASNSTSNTPPQPIELEAVISCTSDGLVVCLRRARPLPQQPSQAAEPIQRAYQNGLYAVPWSTNPVMPSYEQRRPYHHTSFAPSLSPAQARHSPMAQPANTNGDFMNSIRECAIFAWALCGINGSVADYSSGKPVGEATPPAGLSIWQPEEEQHQRQSLYPSKHMNSNAIHSGHSYGPGPAPGPHYGTRMTDRIHPHSSDHMQVDGVDGIDGIDGPSGHNDTHHRVDGYNDSRNQYRWI